MVLPPIVFMGLAAVFVWGMGRHNPEQLPSMLVGHEAARVALAQLGDGVPFTTADLHDGKVKVINFWASWCAPCRAEHPNLMKLKAEGVSIFGVNYKDAPEDALGFLTELGNPFERLGADASGRMGIDWGLYGVPESFVLDGDGKVILRYPGPLTQDTIQSTIRPALAEAAAAR